MQETGGDAAVGDAMGLGRLIEQQHQGGRTAKQGQGPGRKGLGHRESRSAPVMKGWETASVLTEGAIAGPPSQLRDSAGLSSGHACTPPDFPRYLQGVTRWNRYLHCVAGKPLGHYWGWRASQPSISSEEAVIQLPATRRPIARQRGWGGSNNV